MGPVLSQMPAFAGRDNHKPEPRRSDAGAARDHGTGTKLSGQPLARARSSSMRVRARGDEGNFGNRSHTSALSYIRHKILATPLAPLYAPSG